MRLGRILGLRWCCSQKFKHADRKPALHSSSPIETSFFVNTPPVHRTGRGGCGEIKSDAQLVIIVYFTTPSDGLKVGDWVGRLSVNTQSLITCHHWFDAYALPIIWRQNEHFRKAHPTWLISLLSLLSCKRLQRTAWSHQRKGSQPREKSWWCWVK